MEVIVENQEVIASAGDDGVTNRVDDEGVIAGTTDQGLGGIIGNKKVSKCGCRTVKPVANFVAGEGLTTQDAIVSDDREVEGIRSRRAQRADRIGGRCAQGSNGI